jgi:hypothetical protein
MSKVQLLDAEADIRLVYTVDETPVPATLGGTACLVDPTLADTVILVDRVSVQYWYPVEDETDPFSISVDGWRTNKDGKRDKRAKERTHVYMKWQEVIKFVKYDLGIDYEADFAKFWKAGK